ncbi:hypothetical protein BBJ28_00005318 [Nothophytophthora sp. Chile5]|nr:hypothetical protein BBJ28_00005318 [Nothophytophthora sp. Chile5]
MLATRTYSVKVEMFRQLALDSGIRPCGADAETWAVFYREPHCVEAVACSVAELEALLHGENQTKTGEEACVAAGVNDVELAVDHKYPHLAPSAGPLPVSGILYGLVGTPTFHAFHEKLVALARINEMQYMVRHYPRDSPLETLLQGYGVALDIKNMEYKTIDDSKKTGENAELQGPADEEEEDEDDDIDDEEVEGFLFKPLIQRHGAISEELKRFYDVLIKQGDDDQQEIKAWHLKDLGVSAARAILDAKNPLKKMQTLAQDFPLQAKKLAFSRKTLSVAFRDEIETRRQQAANKKLKNKFILNGIAVDPMERSFNVFDLMKTLKEEWSVAKQLGGLPLNQSELDVMLSNVRDTSQEQPAVRIHVRGALDGSTPLYLNNIETDPNSARWSPEVDTLRRPAWNLIFLRKNMYEYILAFDPLTSAGRTALGHVGFMRMRGAPIQWGLLVSSKELMASKTSEDRRALVETYKTLTTDDKASAWHFAKLLMLAQSKDAAEGDIANGEGEETEGEEAETETRKDQIRPTTIAAAFLQGVADDGSPDVLISGLLSAYAEATSSVGTIAENGVEALELLQSERFDDEVLAMTEFIHLKHLSLGWSLFNGVLQKNLDVQKSVMGHFGRDQPLYVAMAHQDALSDDMNLVEELMASQGVYPAYLSIFEKPAAKHPGDAEVPAPKHLLADDVDGRLEAALQSAVSYLHAPGSRALPKKQTVLFPADLSDPRDAGHVYRVVKAVLENSEQDLRVGVVHRVKPETSTADEEDEPEVGELVAAILAAVSDSDQESHLKFVLEALNCVAKQKTVDATRAKLVAALNKMAKDKDAVFEKVRALLKSSPGKWLTSDQRDAMVQCYTLLRSRFPPATSDESDDETAAILAPHLFINGRRVDLPPQSLTDEDVATIVSFDLKYRTQPVAKALIKRSATLSISEADELSFTIVRTTGIVDKYIKTPRTSRLDVGEDSLNSVRLPGDPSLQVAAYVDPLSEASQMMSSMLLMLHSQLNATVELVLLPAAELTEFPLQRFYRYLFEKQPSLAATNVEFRKLPVQPILTMKIETPEAWNVQILHAGDDLDNLRVDPDSPAEVKATTSAVFRLESLLVYGQCRDMTFNMYAPPNGLQLVLERELGVKRMHRDTLVMKNLGYFQLQATPGVWSLHLARGRAAELFDIIDPDVDLPLEAQDVSVYDFGSHIMQLMVRKKEGMELEELLESVDQQEQSKKAKKTKEDVEPIAEDAGVFGSYWNSMLSLMGKKSEDAAEPQQEAATEGDSASDEETALVPSSARSGETIHVFSLASGYLYERFIKIMMSSVLKRTNNPVTFWLLENFLSPDFKSSIPVLREQFGMDIRLVTYKWPNWLRQQTEKQRIIWGYKILFLDVLFPLGVQKIIYVDADQVVRADLKELLELDLQGKPYGYTPFCDSRNVGFQFWRQGYWKEHLRGKPYHISALYVVDLTLFRQMAAGDMLRAVYSQLSADPNSLSNLDQDLPNYAQHQIPIFSLPQEWLWCESWCSDETKATAKTIDLCNNPKHKEPKLDMAKRVIAGELFNESWIELDQEIKDAEARFVATA